MQVFRKINAVMIMAIILSLAAGAAHAARISFTATDLADTMAGEDLWQYSYAVSDHTFTADTGFTIYFDPGLYGTIDPMPPAPNADWNSLTWDPDPGIPDDGAYDAYALVEDASLDDAFTVSFVWLGGGTPGGQTFDIYDAMTWDVLETGNTVPEPAILILLGSGLLGLLANRRT